MKNTKPVILLWRTSKVWEGVDGTDEGVDGEVGIGVEATNKSGLPFTIRWVNKSLILRSSSVSIAFAIEERRALSCTLSNEFATVCKDLFNTTLL